MIDGDETALAADVRANYNLRIAEGIVAASAISSGWNAILTNDEDLKALHSIKVVFVGDLV